LTENSERKDFLLYSERLGSLNAAASASNSAGNGPVDKPVLLVLHGWAHSIQVVKPFAELLSDDFEVHLLDLPGHGKTSAPAEVWAMEDFARCVKGYLDDQGISQVTMIGHSFGGKTSMKLASMYPELIQSLVLINSSGIPPIRPVGKRVKIFLISKLRSLVKLVDKSFNLSLFRSWFVPKFASPDYLNAGPMLKTFVRTVNEDLSEIMPKLNHPTLLLWGEKDTETPLEMGERFNELLPNSKLVVLKGKDHVPFQGAGAHQCAASIKKFLKKQPS
jgi:pimeloyl-ACP methyl ester carboxylesterase